MLLHEACTLFPSKAASWGLHPVPLKDCFMRPAPCSPQRLPACGRRVEVLRRSDSLTFEKENLMLPSGSNFHAAVLIAIMSVCTILLRALPFLIWGGKKKTPAYITYLGQVLPQAIIGMLVIYCFKDVSLRTAPHGIPELLAGLSVVVLQAWKHNSLCSILGGTLAYMALVQFVF